MVRLLTFLVLLLTAICGELAIENHAVRVDQARMEDSYAAFLAKKAGKHTLGELINQRTLAVFKSPKGMVGCAVVGQ